MGFENIFYMANLWSSFRRKPESRATFNPLDSGFRRNDEGMQGKSLGM